MPAPELLIRRARPEDARELAPRLRAEDAAEVRAASGQGPLEALERALAMSEDAWAAYFDGELACLWGVVPLSSTALCGRRGSAWLLTSDLVERHRKRFWRACVILAPQLFERWDVLVNAIDARHTKAVRWGRRLGLHLEPAVAAGVEGRPFHFFTFRKEA